MDSLLGEKELQHFFMNNGEIIALLREFSQTGYTKGEIKFKNAGHVVPATNSIIIRVRFVIWQDSSCQAVPNK